MFGVRFECFLFLSCSRSRLSLSWLRVREEASSCLLPRASGRRKSRKDREDESEEKETYLTHHPSSAAGDGAPNSLWAS